MPYGTVEKAEFQKKYSFDSSLQVGMALPITEVIGSDNPGF
jgi:hypothetical protein